MVDSFNESNSTAVEDESIKGINKKPLWISRKIILDFSGEMNGSNKYPSNNYSGSKYNFFQYFFLALWIRCQRIPVIVAFISFIMSFFIYSKKNEYRWILLGPSLFFTILPPFFVDMYIYARTRISDYKINNRYCLVFDPNKMEFILSKWKNLKVGDIVCVLDGEQFPADVVVLHSSGKRAYISSEMVDGSRLVRTCEPTGSQTDLERAIKDFILNPARITCDVPSGDINHFEGSLKWEGKPRAVTLTIDNFAQMFSRLRFANWVLAIVVYAGTDTRIAFNQHSAFESKARYYPRIKLENVASMLCVMFFIVFTSIVFILSFPNKYTTFESYMNKIILLNELKGHIEKFNWYVICEFTVVFHMCVPITLTAINDLIRIVGIIRLSINSSITNELSKEESLQESKSNIFYPINYTKNEKNDNNNKTNCDSSEKNNKRNLDLFFHRYDSLDSFGEVDFSLICQNSLMESQPVRLKTISLNNGQEYNFKKALKINTSPKFSIVSGLVWKHHSITWHRNETSRFINGSLKVTRPYNNSSLRYFNLIPSEKLELFHYYNVLSSISKLNIINQKEKHIFNDKKKIKIYDRIKDYNNKKKIRKYYTKLLFQMKGFKNTIIDEPPDPYQFEFRDTWPPLPKIRLNINRKLEDNTRTNTESDLLTDQQINIDHNNINQNNIYSTDSHPASPLHLFPKRMVRLLNHIILSNKRKKISISDIQNISNSFKSTINHNSHSEFNFVQKDHHSSNVKSTSLYENRKDYRIFDTKSIQINKEENEEILYLLFNNIVKLTKNFYGWNNQRKYKLVEEYSLLIKNLLLESLNYSLKNSYKKNNKSFNNKTNSDIKFENSNDDDDNNFVLINMLYAMAICNTTVPHLRIVESKEQINSNDQEFCNIKRSKSSPNLMDLNCKSSRSLKKLRQNYETPIKIMKKSLVSLKSIISNNKKKISYSSNNKFKIITSIKKKISKNIKNFYKNKSMPKLVPCNSRNSLSSISLKKTDHLNSIKHKRSSSTVFFSSQEYFNIRDDKTSKSSDENNNSFILHRYNKEYEKLQKQRRNGNISILSKEILLTRCYINTLRNENKEKYIEIENLNNEKLNYDEHKINENDLEKLNSGVDTEKSLFIPSRGVSFNFNQKINKNQNWKKDLLQRSKKLKFSFTTKSKNEKIKRYNEDFPKSYVQYSGVDENDLTIVHTAASCGMRLVLINSQHVVVESLGKTIFASLIYKSEDANKQEISVIVKFYQKERATLYVRGVAEHLIPLLNPLSIKSNHNFFENNHIQNYEDLIHKIRKLEYQGCKVYVFAKKSISKEELDRLKLRRNLMERTQDFKFLLDSSAEEYFASLKTNLEYLGHVGIEYRIQEKVPRSIRTLLEYGIKPWFLFNISSVNSIRLLHKIFPYYDKIPLIRLDRLPLKNKNKAMAFLSTVFNELKIIVDNNYKIIEENNFRINNIDNKNILNINTFSNVNLLKNIITISTPNGEVQLSQLYLGIGSDNYINSDWINYNGNLFGHGSVNSLPGLVFSALQLNEIFQSRDLLNYFFSVAIICPFVLVSNSTFSDINTITNYLRNNVLPRPVILGISGNTGNVPILSSCDISVSVSLLNNFNEKKFSISKKKNNKKQKNIRYNSSTSNKSFNYMSDDQSQTIDIGSSINSLKTNSIRNSSINIRTQSFQNMLKNKSNKNNRVVLTPVTDVTISKFHQIIPLLSRAGRVISFRTSVALFNNIFKVFYLILPHLIYQFYCEWSSTLVYSLDLISIYSIFWTVFPLLFYGFTGIDVPTQLLDLPFLYNCSRSGYYSLWINYLYSLLEAVILGLISFYFGTILTYSSSFQNGISSDLSVLSASQTLYCVLGSLCSFLTKSKSFSLSYILVLLFLMSSLILVIFILNLTKQSYNYLFDLYGLFSYKSPIFFLSLPLFISFVFLFNSIWKIIMYYTFPDPSTLIKDWWLIHIHQSSRVYKKPIKDSLKKSFLTMEFKNIIINIYLYIKTSLWIEWTIIKHHLLLGFSDDDGMINDTYQYSKIPILTDTISSQYENFILEKIEKRKRDSNNIINTQPQILNSKNINSSQIQFRDQIQPQVVYSNSHINEQTRSYIISINSNKSDIQKSSLETITQKSSENISYEQNINSINMNTKKLKFNKPIHMSYFGDNRIQIENDDFLNWQKRIFIHAIMVWNPKQVYINNLMPSKKKLRIKGIRSLQFAQSLRKFSTRELEEYNNFIIEYSSYLYENKIGLIPPLMESSYQLNINKNNHFEKMNSNIKNFKTINVNFNSNKGKDSIVDLNINLMNNSNYTRISSFSEDVKSLLNPYKLTFKVSQLELEYQIERQLEIYQHRYALRAVLFVLSGIFITLGPFAVNVSGTEYKWVGLLCILFCLSLFTNFALSYINGKNSLTVSSQLQLLTIISVSSILASSHGFALAVIYPILSFIIFRLGFVPGVYVTIIGFVSVVLGQFLWGMPNSYWIRFLPILIGINAFCGFLGYRSELLYRAQFLLRTHTNDLRQRQRKILDAMLPSFIVERLLINQNSNSISSHINVEDRGIVSVLFCDIYDFHTLVAVLEPAKLISLLDYFFLTLDCLIDKYNCTKIETVFETYLVASCLDPYNELIENEENYNFKRKMIFKKAFKDIINLLRFALKMHKIASTFFYEIPKSKNIDLNHFEFENQSIMNSRDKNPYISTGIDIYLKQLKLKIGIHSGRVISGVVGTNKPQYALFGDTVNTASRMKSSCDSGKIQVTSMTYDLIKDIPILKWKEKRSFVKGKGIMDTFTLENVSGSAYPNYILLNKKLIRGKGVNSIQIGNYSLRLCPDFDLLSFEDILYTYLYRKCKRNFSKSSLISDCSFSNESIPADPNSPIYAEIKHIYKIKENNEFKNSIQKLSSFKNTDSKNEIENINKIEGSFDYSENNLFNDQNEEIEHENNEEGFSTLNSNTEIGDNESKIIEKKSSQIKNDEKSIDHKSDSYCFNSEYEEYGIENKDINTCKKKENSKLKKRIKWKFKFLSRSENGKAYLKETASNLMSITLCFHDNNIEQKYLLTYYSNLTTIKTIEESLVIVVVTLVLQALIYSVVPCGIQNQEDYSGYRILWTVRIIYISSVFLSWLVLFSNYTNHQLQNSKLFPNSSKIQTRGDLQEQVNYECINHVGGPILLLNAVLAGGASMLMLTILWQFTMVNNSVSIWCDEEIIELLLLAAVHHNAGLLFRYIVLFDMLILFLLITILLTGINVNLEGMVVYCVSLLVNIIAAYSREKTGRTIFYNTLEAGNCEQKAEELLIAMLPRKVLIDFQEDRLKLAYIHKNVTFLFSDICGFTQWAMSVEAENVVYMLSSLYARFDESISKFGLFKLFTIGDAYVAMSEPELDTQNNKSNSKSRRKNKDSPLSYASNRSSLSGLYSGISSKISSSSSKDNYLYNLSISNLEGYSPAEGARRSIAMAHDMLQQIALVREKLNLPELNMRIGLHYGGCIGGIVGSSRLRYEVWGHDVIIGNRMETCGTPGNITISGQLYEVLYKNFNNIFKFNYIGSVKIRKQQIEMYRARIRRNVQLKINRVSNSENISNLIKRNILSNNEKFQNNL